MAQPRQPSAPNAHAQFTAPARKYPIQPKIPAPALQALIPRLTTTINEIDAFNTLLAQGQVDGSLPSWDTLLQRYATLLGRINSVSSYLSLPPPPPPLRPGAPPPGPDAQRPALERIIVHPLNPLPDPAQPSLAAQAPLNAVQGNGGAAAEPTTAGGVNSEGGSAALHPIAHEAFFQVINTQPLPSLLSAQSTTVTRASTRAGWATTDEAALRRLNAGFPVEGVEGSANGGGPAVVEALRRKLEERLKREEGAAKGLRELVQEKEEEYDWGMRIDETGEGEEGEGGKGETAGEKGQGAGKVEEDEDDDLFGDDEDIKIIEPPAGAAAAAQAGAGAGTGTSVQQTGSGFTAVGEPKLQNPRAGWSVADYVRYMDTGKAPASLVST